MGFSWLAKQRQKENAVDQLYAKAVAQARLPIFYSERQVPDTVDGRFDLLALHMFLLLHRLGGEGAAAKSLAQSLFDLMFDDMDRSLREMGVSDMAVGKRVKEMARALYGRIDAYEPALSDASRLEAALARNLYRGVAVDASSLAAMSGYVAQQVAILAALDLDALCTTDQPCFAPPVP